MRNDNSCSGGEVNNQSDETTTRGAPRDIFKHTMCDRSLKAFIARETDANKGQMALAVVEVQYLHKETIILCCSQQISGIVI